MADEVRRILERMLPELEDFEEKGIFTRKQVKEIAKRRSDFEYLLQRRTVKLSDYERYIEYEKRLEKLVEKRKKRLHIRAIGQHVRASTRRINFIYERALMKFPGNKLLWKRAFLHAKTSKSYQFSSKLFARSLELHPRDESFWILASNFEFEENNDILAARSLMQRGLRLNKKSPDMWLDYFRLELLYLGKLHERRRILGLDATSKSLQETKTINNEVLIQNGTITEDKGEVPNQSDDTNTLHSKQLQKEVLFEGKIPLLVYTKAVETIPDDIDFRGELARIVGEHFSSSITPIAKKLADRIWTDVESHTILSQDPKTWKTRVHFELECVNSKDNNLDNVSESKDVFTRAERRALALFERAEGFCRNMPLLHEFKLGFLCSLAFKEDEKNSARLKEVKTIAHSTLRNDTRITDKSCELLLELDSSKSSIEFCLARNPRKLTILKHLLGKLEQVEPFLEPILENVLQETTKRSYDPDEILNVWLIYLELTMRDDNYSFEAVIQEFLRALASIYTCSSQDSSPQITCVLKGLFDWIANMSNPGKVLVSVLERIEKSGIPPILSSDVYRAFLAIGKDHVNKDAMKQVLDRATNLHSQDSKLWIDYLQFARSNGDLLLEKTALRRAVYTGCLTYDDLYQKLVK